VIVAKYGDGSKYGSGVKYAKAGAPTIPTTPPPLDFGKYKPQQRKDRIMNDRDAARYDMFKRVGDFGVNHAAEFEATPPATGPTKAQTLFTQLGTVDDPETGASVMARITAATKGRQTASGAFHGGTTSKAVLRDGLKLELRGLYRSASAIAEAQGRPEIMDSFAWDHDLRDDQLVAKARAFAAAAEPMQADFIALEHPANFIEGLLQRVADFEEADSAQNTAQQEAKGATASISPLIQEGLTLVKQLDAIMCNKYRSNAAMMGEWTAASHVERVATSKKPAQPAPTPPAPTP
jgi:hypothetical protein